MIWPALKEGTTKTRCLTKQTPIKAVTSPGLDRSITVAGNYPILFLPIEDTITKMNLMANECNKVFTCREMVKLLATGKAFKQGDKFTSGPVLDYIKGTAIKNYTEYNHALGVAREAEVIPQKGITDFIVSLVTYFIDTEEGDLNDMFDPYNRGYTEDFYSHMTDWSDFQRQMAYTVWANANKIVTETDVREYRNAVKLKRDITKYIKRVGHVTIALLWDLINIFCPGNKTVRKTRALLILMGIYDLTLAHITAYIQANPNFKPQEIDDTLITVDEQGNIIIPECVVSSVATNEEGGIQEEEEDISSKGLVDSIPVREECSIPIIATKSTTDYQNESIETESTLPSTDTESMSPPYYSPTSGDSLLGDMWADEDDYAGILPVPVLLDTNPAPELNDLIAEVASSGSTAILREEANRLLSLDTDTIIDSYNDAIRSNLCTYVPLDAGDIRQLALMLTTTSPIPPVYRRAPGYSPRYYSKEADNLFYCRKSMRLTALEGLGLYDVDLTSCHTYVLLAQWGSRLPLLQKAISTGSLWDMYKEHFAAHGLPFFKKAIKPLHYASILGGGTKAFKTSVRRYNLEAELHNIQHPDDLRPVLNEEGTDNYIEVFKLSPVYQEIRGLLKHLSNRWHNKYIMLPTGERFAVESYSFVKGEDGKTRRVLGNFLSVYSSYLQSVEVSLMSYLIVDCHEYFTPLLWQHDGLTIKCHDDSTLDRLKASLNDACILFTNGVQIPLSVEYLG